MAGPCHTSTTAEDASAFLFPVEVPFGAMSVTVNFATSDLSRLHLQQLRLLIFEFYLSPTFLLLKLRLRQTLLNCHSAHASVRHILSLFIDFTWTDFRFLGLDII